MFILDLGKFFSIKVLEIQISLHENYTCIKYDYVLSLSFNILFFSIWVQHPVSAHSSVSDAIVWAFK